MFKIINRLKNKKGFTLIELIVVLAVLGIIAMIAVPRYLTVQAGARISADNASAASIAKAAELYYIQTGDATITTLGDLTASAYLDPGVTSNWQSDDDTDGYKDGITITISTATGDVTIQDGSTTKQEMYPNPAN